MSTPTTSTPTTSTSPVSRFTPRASATDGQRLHKYQQDQYIQLGKQLQRRQHETDALAENTSYVVDVIDAACSSGESMFVLSDGKSPAEHMAKLLRTPGSLERIWSSVQPGSRVLRVSESPFSTRGNQVMLQAVALREQLHREERKRLKREIEAAEDRLGAQSDITEELEDEVDELERDLEEANYEIADLWTVIYCLIALIVLMVGGCVYAHDYSYNIMLRAVMDCVWLSAYAWDCTIMLCSTAWSLFRVVYDDLGDAEL
jgi:hypothetical protein